MMKVCLILAIVAVAMSAPAPPEFGKAPAMPTNTSVQTCPATGDCDCLYDPPQLQDNNNNGKIIDQFSPWSLCQPECNGTQFRCRKVAQLPKGNGACRLNGTFVPTPQVGQTDCQINQCSASSCINRTDPCNSTTPYCLNAGYCFLDPQAANQAACQCAGTWKGPRCDQTGGTDNCNATMCGANGKCYNLNGAANCVCNPGFFGTNCESNPCNNFCQNGAACSVSFGTAYCACTAGWTGRACNVSNSTNPCTGAGAPTCGTNGACVSEYGKARCKCNTGFSGDSCQTNQPLNSQCDTAATVRCVMNVQGDPTSAAGKCASFNSYANCASQFKCFDMLSVWCNMYFQQLPSCPINSCSAQSAGCDMQVYQACYGDVNRTLATQSFSPCEVAFKLAGCAAAAKCSDLLKNFCSQTGSSCQATPPSDCANINKNNELVDLSVLPGGELFHPSNVFQKKHSSSSIVIVGGAAAAMVVAVVVAAAIYRRRRVSSSLDAPLL